jgi:hypothetical protein
LTKNLSIFNPKHCYQGLKKYGLDPGSVKTYPGSGVKLIRIQGQKEPGNVSATLLQNCRTSGMKSAGFTSQKMRSKENSQRETTNAAE